MEIIYHTADVNKDIDTLESILSSGLSTVELDFVMSKDGIPIWTHNILPTQLLNSKSAKERKQLTLYEVLEITSHRCKLMLDLKYIPKSILKSNDFSKLLQYLNNYDEMQFQSLDLAVLNKIIDGDYSNLEVGLIINVLTRWYINNIRIPKLPNLDFMAISSELWERQDGVYLDKCNTLYPDVKKYAWTWATREENEERIKNFIDKNADGIITGNPTLVKSLMK